VCERDIDTDKELRQDVEASRGSAGSFRAINVMLLGRVATAKASAPSRRGRSSATYLGGIEKIAVRDPSWARCTLRQKLMAQILVSRARARCQAPLCPVLDGLGTPAVDIGDIQGVV